ncbi:MAG: ankyrin repeat domain-containing protein [Candidatus Berkiella sp.]
MNNKSSILAFADIIAADTLAIFPPMEDADIKKASTEDTAQDISLVDALREMQNNPTGANHLPSPLKSSGFIQPIRVEQTPLHVAATKGDVNEIKRLLKAGWNVNQEDHRSAMPIHIASMFGHLEAVQVLVQHGADLKDKSYEGQTALHLAVLNYHVDVVRHLLNAGANPKDKTYVNHSNTFDQALKLLDGLTDELLKSPKNPELLAQAKNIVHIIDSLCQHSQAPFLATHGSNAKSASLVPISVLLDVFSSYIEDNTLKTMILDIAQKIAIQDNSGENYIRTKTFLNTFATSETYLVKIHKNQNTLVETDGYYAKYITKTMAQTAQGFSACLEDAQAQKVFDKISASLKLAYEYAQNFADPKAAEAALAHYQEGETVLLPTGWRGHSVATFFSKPQATFAVANAGKHYFEDPFGVIFYKLSDPEKVSENHFHKILANQEQLLLEFKSLYELGINGRFGFIETPKQAHGNCTHYSFKIVVEGLAMIEYLNLGLSIEEAQAKAHHYAEQFEIYHNTYLIDDMITEHSLLDMNAYKDIYSELLIQAKDSTVAKETSDHLKAKIMDVFHVDLEAHNAPSQDTKIHLGDVLEWIGAKLPTFKTAAGNATDSPQEDNRDLCLDNNSFTPHFNEINGAPIVHALDDMHTQLQPDLL